MQTCSLKPGPLETLPQAGCYYSSYYYFYHSDTPIRPVNPVPAVLPVMKPARQGPARGPWSLV